MAAAKSPKEKAGVVAYRMAPGGDPLVLLVTSRKNKESWVFPGGTVEEGESLEAAAQRECAEEAGYKVDLGIPLPPVEVLAQGAPSRFTFFLATVIGNSVPWETDRKREWHPSLKVPDLVPDVIRDVALDAVQRITQMNA